MLDRNPLENIRNTNSIRYVMKNGELYEADTLNMVWPQQKTAAEAVLVGYRAETGAAGADDAAVAVGAIRGWPPGAAAHGTGMVSSAP